MKKMLAILLCAVASAAAACDSCTPTVVYSTVAACPPVTVCPAPAPKKVLAYVDEEYTANEIQSETVNELRTREVVKKVDVLKEKILTDTIIKKVESPTGRQPRLARGKQFRLKQYTVKEKIKETEEYIQPVVYKKTVPVTRTRKIPVLVDVAE